MNVGEIRQSLAHDGDYELKLVMQMESDFGNLRSNATLDLAGVSNRGDVLVLSASNDVPVSRVQDLLDALDASGAADYTPIALEAPDDLLLIPPMAHPNGEIVLIEASGIATGQWDRSIIARG